MAVEAVRRPWRAAAGVSSLLAAGLAHPQQPPAVTPRLQACMACHGPQGNSQIPTIPSLAGQPRLFLENQLVVIREGLREVPQVKGMLAGVKDEEIVQMAAFFAAQQPVAAAGGPRNEATLARGKDLASKALCGSCHLPDSSGRQQIPRLAGQHEAFLLDSMKQFRDHPGPGRDTIMSAALYGLKDGELADLAHYLAHYK